MSILYILIAILLLGILVVAHEFGHFIAARLTGIEVTEFAVGFGPKLLSRKSGKTGTTFSLRAIPLGGFCAFYGEDDASGQTKDDPRAYNKQSVWKRMFTVLMGPMMNFILAFVVAVVYVFCVGVADVEPYLGSVEANSPAAQAGLQPLDVICEVNGVNVLDGTLNKLLEAIDGPDELMLTVRRDGETLTIPCTPFWDAEGGQYRIGIGIQSRSLGTTHPVSLLTAIRQSWDTCVYAGGIILKAIGGLITRGEGFEQTSGPVGVVSIVSQEVRAYGLDAFFNLLVVISINLGIMNLLPIPGLDGSRFLFMVAEAIRRKPVPQEKEAMVHLVGMLFLFSLMIFFTFRDVMKLFL